MAVNPLQELALAILACKEAECPYRGTFAETFYGPGRKPQWLYWWENEFLSQGAPRPASIDKYVPFRYNGNSKIMFVALRPSTEDFPSNADMLLAEVLIECRLAQLVFGVDKEALVHKEALVYYEGVFVTDIIKCRGLAKEKVERIPESCKSYLRRELEIIRPHRIIAMGRQTRDILWGIRNEIGLGNCFRTVEDIPWRWHYAYAFRRRKIKEYREQFSEIVAKLSVP